MSKSLNNDLVRIRYALESVHVEDREAIVRLVEAAACAYGEQAEEAAAMRSFVSRGGDDRPIIWRGK